MPRKKKVVTKDIVPAQMKADFQTMQGILGRLSTQAEDVAKEALMWVRKHKFLVLISIAIVAFSRYWLEEEKDEEEDY